MLTDHHHQANEILNQLNHDPNAYNQPSATTKPKPDRRVSRARDSVQPYSKSHAKRLKKKAKEQAVVGDLRPVIAALDEVLTTTPTTAPSNPVEKSLPARAPQEPSTAATQPKPASKKALSHKQKAKVLREESIRLPAILSHPEFKKNPFAAIRTHIQNSS
ncbi:hypothetical protein PtA15_3A324 [Puccinia triticina]|uniref:Ribosome biogenesis protein SLX9 n=1 Tax=Puccinia triticina TaxID=208348 RepID=A0ABY7CCK7_9BASI|nr:uncharacterized protein PtA15_3A324 [Puccinia triticina]WAQ82958.1 hypothetical protein PtA15_3A324 [Puccinia triticina]WAR53785.1 hypothetical protein PtB15_3B294 [Puccinia triticina]